ncbi:hypothetical protein CMO96_03250 [Candidatus Woesebacteria bacterium]|nr:hypothetical protein [Candidatus Woesebacteria bacterium]
MEDQKHYADKGGHRRRGFNLTETRKAFPGSGWQHEKRTKLPAKEQLVLLKLRMLRDSNDGR